MCCECVCAIVSDYASVFIDTSACMYCECVCAFVSEYASVYSLIQVRPCVGSLCSLIQVHPCVVSVCVCLCL